MNLQSYFVFNLYKYNSAVQGWVKVIQILICAFWLEDTIQNSTGALQMNYYINNLREHHNVYKSACIHTNMTDDKWVINAFICSFHCHRYNLYALAETFFFTFLLLLVYTRGNSQVTWHKWISKKRIIKFKLSMVFIHIFREKIQNSNIYPIILCLAIHFSLKI